MLAWGAKVEQDFRDKVFAICKALAINPQFLMACMAFESAETFNAAVKNAAGSGAVGLIQFMPQTAHMLGTSTEELVSKTNVQQLDDVENYFKPSAGKIVSLSDMYMAILWPAAIGKPDDWVLFDQNDTNHPALYIQNKGLDFNKDGKITKIEASYGVLKKLEIGLRSGYASE
jgi:hypothetical protein